MLCLKVANDEDIEKEYLFVRDIPENEIISQFCILIS